MASCLARRRLVITGVVQGVGFRPFVWRRAMRAGLTGFVENTPAGVVVEVEGPAEAVVAFERDLAVHPPPLAVIDRVVATACDVPTVAQSGPFRILETVGGDGLRTDVPPDVATCRACLAELRDPTDRRHGHPFISCTDCGPRFTIIERLPYDRPATTMGSFPMCPHCAADYADPADRRFHAQPICCPACGPAIWFARLADGVPVNRPREPGLAAAAIAAAQRLLAAGGILAVKNLGGFQLACDATNPAVVAALRLRKHRPRKPLAVMVMDLAAARGLATVDDQTARLLVSPERPIVLVPKRRASPLAAEIAEGNDFVGLMLPSAPLQHLLGDGLPPLVMTSGNLADEPIAIDNAEAVERLAGIADGFLMHDRPIHVPCDDSVVRCVAGMPLPIRRSRGHVPLPVRLVADGPCVIAVGGELKAALCLATGDRAIMSQHLGDVGNLETLAAVEQAAAHLLALFAATPVAIAADLHPGYLSADWASRFARARGLPLIRIQHHEAHAAALLTEHFGSPLPTSAASPCLIACFDGTGYGPSVAVGAPGIIRGGEFFLADDVGLRHVASLAPFPLPGGDAAIRHPWRIALALLHAAGIAWDDRLPAVAAATAAERRLLRQQLDRDLACVPTTSMGRLFDGVAALVGGPPTVTFEAEAALMLESRAARWAEPDETRFNFTIGSASTSPSLVIDWRPLVAAIVADVIAGEPAAGIAAGFHRAVVQMIETVRCTLGPKPPTTVGLTGGVFQNATLVEQATAGLRSTGCSLLLHHAVPPNDGGLALGQALLARERLSHGSG